MESRGASASVAERSFAHIVMRLLSLRLAGVLRDARGLGRGADGHGHGHGHGHDRDAVAATLWRWSRVLGDVYPLLDEVLAPALLEPGREHRRESQVHRGRPRGAVRWPQTVRRNLEGPRPGGLRFVCSQSQRSLLAPENLLLLWTLEDLAGRARRAGGRLEQRGLLRADERALLRQGHERIRAALREPWVAQSRARVDALRRSPAAARARAELEAAVRERTRGRPCAAPEWARRLLELDGESPRLPDARELETLDPDALWTQLASLELLSLARTGTGLRQESEGEGFRGAAGQRFAAYAGTPAWLLERGGAGRNVATLICSEGTWAQVKARARDCIWELPAERLIVVHRSVGAEGKAPAVELARQGGLEILYWRLLPGAASPLTLTASVRGWLAP